jgi:DNA-binding transcriptional ArsR family regulator
MAGQNSQGAARREDIEVRLGKAMAHPVRVRILEMMNERPIAPVEVANGIGVALSNVSYHFRTLLELDCIEAVGQEQVRGSMKTTWRSKVKLMFADLCFAGLDTEAKSALTGKALRTMAVRVGDAFAARTLESRSDLHLSVQTISVNDEGWTEIASLLTMVMERVGEIERESADDLASERFPATVSLMSFESPKLYENRRPV